MVTKAQKYYDAFAKFIYDTHVKDIEKAVYNAAIYGDLIRIHYVGSDIVIESIPKSEILQIQPDY
jgi:hypothetical protein